MPKFSVAIIGGGIGGTALAYMIQRFAGSEVDVQVYEASSQFGEIGAGLSVWPRTLELFNVLGLGEGESGYQKYATFSPEETRHVAYSFHRSDRNPRIAFFNRTSQGGLASFHRAKLLDLFASVVPASHVHFNKRITSYKQADSKVTLMFSDGTTAIADALVAADGVHSVVRQQILDCHIQNSKDDDKPALNRLKCPSWSRTVAYRFLVDTEKLQSLDPSHPSLTGAHHFCGTSCHYVTYPIDHGVRINFVTCIRHPDASEDEVAPTYEDLYPLPPTKAELDAHFQGWDEDTQTILKCIEEPTRWPIITHQPNPFWSDNRVVLVGDAAHAMAPHNASGAGMAIEDAFVLSTLLAHDLTTPETLPLAFKAFEKVRIPPVHRAMNSSWACGYIYEFLGQFKDDLPKLGPEIMDVTSWIDEFNPSELQEDATSCLKQIIQDAFI